MAAEEEKNGIHQAVTNLEHPVLTDRPAPDTEASPPAVATNDDPEEAVSWSTLMAVFVNSLCPFSSLETTVTD